MIQVSSADYIIHKFGGVRQTARLLDISHAAVSKWRKNRRIPSENFDKIIEVAKENRVKLTAKNLVFGGAVSTKKKGK